MAKRESINSRAKKAENRVSQYLFGTNRDWKDQHDISGVDFDGREWYGEVKNWEWPSGPKSLISLMEKALNQVKDATNKQRLFVVFIPTYCEVEDSLVMYSEDYGVSYHMFTLKNFHYLLWGNKSGREQAQWSYLLKETKSSREEKEEAILGRCLSGPNKPPLQEI